MSTARIAVQAHEPGERMCSIEPAAALGGSHPAAKPQRLDWRPRAVSPLLPSI
jgi:hypothetical protein